ncbi:MAG: hypothetical protein ABI743_09915 [bacterium]
MSDKDKKKKKPATVGPWPERWRGKLITVSLIDETAVAGTLADLNDWGVLIALVDPAGAEIFIPFDSVFAIEYHPDGLMPAEFDDETAAASVVSLNHE